MKKDIFNELLKFYKLKMVYAILRGERNPSLQAIVSIEENLNIPAKAWLDIKSYLNSYEHSTKQHTKQSTTEVA